MVLAVKAVAAERQIGVKLCVIETSAMLAQARNFGAFGGCESYSKRCQIVIKVTAAIFSLCD
jgi:hypothetical protein